MATLNMAASMEQEVTAKQAARKARKEKQEVLDIDRFITEQAEPEGSDDPRSIELAELIVEMERKCLAIMQSDAWRCDRLNPVQRHLIMGALAFCRQLQGKRDRLKFFPYNNLNEIIGVTEKNLKVIEQVGRMPRTQSATRVGGS